MSFIYLMILLTSLGIVTASLYPYAALTAALFGAFAIMQQVYLPAATILKRWAGETASMVFVHVDESLHGMEVIKAFDAENYFLQVCSRRVQGLPDHPVPCLSSASRHCAARAERRRLVLSSHIPVQRQGVSVLPPLLSTQRPF